MAEEAEGLLNELIENNDVHVPAEVILAQDLLKETEKQELKIKAYFVKLSNASSRVEEVHIERKL